MAFLSREGCQCPLVNRENKAVLGGAQPAEQGQFISPLLGTGDAAPEKRVQLRRAMENWRWTSRVLPPGSEPWRTSLEESGSGSWARVALRLRDDLITICSCWKGSCKEDRSKLFSVVANGATRAKTQMEVQDSQDGRW